MLRAIMDISAPAFSLADRPPTGHLGHQGSQAPGRPVLHRRLMLSQNSAGKVGDYVIDSLPGLALFLCSCLAAVPSSRPAHAQARRAQGPSRLAVALGSPQRRRFQATPCMRLSKSSAISQHSSLSSSQFLCSTWNPVSSPRPTHVGSRRAQGLSGPAVARDLPRTPTFPGRALTALSTSTRLAWSG